VAAALKERRDARLHPLEQQSNHHGDDDDTVGHPAHRKRLGQHRNAFSASSSSSTRPVTPVASTKVRSSVRGNAAGGRRRRSSQSLSLEVDKHHRMSVVLISGDGAGQELVLIPADDDAVEVSDVQCQSSDNEHLLHLIANEDTCSGTLPEYPGVLPECAITLGERDCDATTASMDTSVFLEAPADRSTGSGGSPPTSAADTDLAETSLTVLDSTIANTCSKQEGTIEEEHLMNFWLQGGTPHPAPLSPAKLVQQRRRIVAAAAAANHLAAERRNKNNR
jgi:hypothetical protein